MKLLLTSAGVMNDSIARALIGLVGKSPGDTSIVFVPTAANVETGDKGWLINDLVALKSQGFGSIDIVDIAAVPEAIWRPRMEAADILFFGGGNTFYLMEQMRASGLAALLPTLLETRVYAGISAGSMVAGPTLALTASHLVYGEDLDRTEDMAGLLLVDFCILPHLNSPFFPKLREEQIRDAIKGMHTRVYALDDQSAIRVVDGVAEVVTEGAYLTFDP